MFLIFWTNISFQLPALESPRSSTTRCMYGRVSIIRRFDSTKVYAILQCAFS